MMAAFDHMPAHARVWIYQADKPLREPDRQLLHAEMTAFIEQWAAHGAQMTAAYDLLYDRFLVIMANEDKVRASGCSLDQAVGVVKAIGAALNIDFLDRKQVAWKDREGNLKASSLSDFKSALTQGILDEDTIVFNNLVATKSEFVTGWEVPLRKSWHVRLV